MKMKTHRPKPMGHCKSSAKGKVHSNTGIPQEIKKEIKICIETNENENTTTQTYGTL